MAIRKIGFIAPSTCLLPSEGKKLNKTAELLRKGLAVPSVNFGPHLFSCDEDIDHVTAGADERAEVFREAVREYDLIISVAGGTGAEDIVRQIRRKDFRVIRERGPLFIGFSDFTFLLNEIYRGAHSPSIYFPFLKLNRNSLERIRALIAGEEIRYRGRDWLTAPPARRLSGIPIGGNLTTFVNFLNRKDPPRFRWKRHILFMEDTHIDVEDLHRFLAALRRHNVFNGIRGIVVGSLTETGKSLHAKKEQNEALKFIRAYLRDIIRARNKEGNPLPILLVSNFGHDIHRNLMAVPIGGHVTISRGKRISFRIRRRGAAGS